MFFVCLLWLIQQHMPLNFPFDMAVAAFSYTGICAGEQADALPCERQRPRLPPGAGLPGQVWQHRFVPLVGLLTS